MDKGFVLYIVVPCYNENAVLNESAKQLSDALVKMMENKKISSESKVVFVDDGSQDDTWELIENQILNNPCVGGVKLAHNVGHQNALYGGLMSVMEDCDGAISIDADLQDDVSAIEKMVDKALDGADVVYGVRNRRDTDTFFKRTTAIAFYKLMRVMGVDVVFNHADFRFMSKRAIEALAHYSEKNLFLRGIVPQIGYKTCQVFYDRKERFAGESKYPLKKMLSFAFDGITSFSVNPIRLITFIGFVTCIAAAGFGIYAIVQKFISDTAPGWASIMCSVWFLGGLQLLGIGLIGEYIGKMYKEVKNRPRYIVEEYRLK